MAMWRKNRGAEDGDSAVGTDESGGGVALATRAAKKRKPHELLSSVVKESTAGAAVALLKDNAAFALPNGRCWVVLGLPVEEIGGLSMKQKNDEAKGSLIELITADEISTVATAEMLTGETFGIIPSAKTLNRMDEFSLLKNARYLWTTLEQRPDGSLKAEPIDYADYETALSISRGNTSLADVLPATWAWGGGDTGTDSAENTATVANDTVEAAADAPFGAAPDTGDSAVDADSGTGVDDPFGGAAEVGEEVDYNAMAADDDGESGSFEDDSVDGGEFVPDFENAPDVDADDDSADGDSGQQEYFDDREVTEEEVRATIARRFLSEDLDLPVDLETFEVNFNTSSPIVTFPVEEDATDWLGQHVNQLARQANTELEQLHLNNQDSLRELWVSLMSNHIEQVIADVSPDREGAYYHRLMSAARADRDALKRESPAQIAAARKALNERYEADAASRGEQAKEQAILRYREQNRPRHEREIAEIGLATERVMEESFDGATQTILEMRRRDANARIDLGKTKILDVLMERQQEQREAEEALLRSWSVQMTEFVDENRKEDIARSEALAAQLSRDTQVADLKAEHAAGVQEMRANQESKIAELNEDIRRIRQDALDELAAREQTWQHQLNLKDKDNEKVNTRVQDLVNQMGTLKDTYKDQYEQRIATLKADKESAEQALLNNSAMMSGFSRNYMAMMIIMFLAVLAVGFIIGFAVSGSPEPAASAAVLTTYAGNWLPAF